MIPFIPDTPASIAFLVALAATAVFTLWRDLNTFPVIAIMIGNWMATRAVSTLELPGSVQAVADITSAVLLLVLPGPRASSIIPVAALFALMVVFSGVHDLNLISRDTMWAWADVAAYFQLVIIAGSAASGGGRARLAMDSHRRRRVPAVVRAAAQRIQAPPPS